MAVRYFRLYYYDDDNKTFGVSEITTDDTYLNLRTCSLQKQGRNVRVSTATELCKTYNQVPDIEFVVRNFGMAGYKYDPDLHW